MPTFSVQISGHFDIGGRYFFDDSLSNKHANVTEEKAADEVRRYVREHGFRKFLDDWELLDLDVFVGNHAVVYGGKATTSTYGAEQPPAAERTK